MFVFFKNQIVIEVLNGDLTLRLKIQTKNCIYHGLIL